MLVNPPVRWGARVQEWGSFEEAAPSFMLKNAPFDYAYSVSTPFVQQCLNSVKLEGKHQFVVVDIKPQRTIPGQYTCLPGWHLDTAENPYDNEELHETHHIMVAFSEDTTEFIHTPLDLPIMPHHRVHDLRKLIEEKAPYQVLKAPRATFITYSRLNFHRGPLCHTEGRRLLIRVSETNVIRGSTQQLPTR